MFSFTVNKVAEFERQQQGNPPSKTGSMERPVPAPRNLPRAGMPGQPGLQDADKARSSPNLGKLLFSMCL